MAGVASPPPPPALAESFRFGDPPNVLDFPLPPRSELSLPTQRAAARHMRTATHHGLATPQSAGLGHRRELKSVSALPNFDFNPGSHTRSSNPRLLPAFEFNPSGHVPSDDPVAVRKIPADAETTGETQLPSFQFNPAGFVSPQNAANPTAESVAAPALPAFNFNPGAHESVGREAGGKALHTRRSSEHSPAPSQTLPGGGHRHRRTASGFVGGSFMQGTANLGSSAPAAYGVMSNARGHRHRRSGALSQHELPTLGPATKSDLHHSEEAHCPTPTSPTRRTEARVGFSDTVELIPRPESIASSESASTTTTVRGHRSSASLASIDSALMHTPIDEEDMDDFLQGSHEVSEQPEISSSALHPNPDFDFGFPLPVHRPGSAAGLSDTANSFEDWSTPLSDSAPEPFFDDITDAANHLPAVMLNINFDEDPTDVIESSASTTPFTNSSSPSTLHFPSAVSDDDAIIDLDAATSEVTSRWSEGRKSMVSAETKSGFFGADIPSHHRSASEPAAVPATFKRPNLRSFQDQSAEVRGFKIERVTEENEEDENDCAVAGSPSEPCTPLMPDANAHGLGVPSEHKLSQTWSWDEDADAAHSNQSSRQASFAIDTDLATPRIPSHQSSFTDYGSSKAAQHSTLGDLGKSMEDVPSRVSSRSGPFIGGSRPSAQTRWMPSTPDGMAPGTGSSSEDTRRKRSSIASLSMMLGLARTRDSDEGGNRCATSDGLRPQTAGQFSTRRRRAPRLSRILKFWKKPEQLEQGK